MMEASDAGTNAGEPKRGLRQILLSYFYWTYPRGTFHYDVMVTLILLFIFITPHLWNYADKPSNISGPSHAMQVVGGNGGELIITVYDVDANVPAGAGYGQVKRALRKAIEPVTGDAVFVDSWETFTDGKGNLEWKVWAHR
jgi:hypothetical protein